MRGLILFAVLVVLLGAGVAVAAWPHPKPVASGFDSDEKLVNAYAHVQTGMPASKLNTVGFDTAKAERLSKLALMERYMPKDSVGFDALDPAVQDCYVGPGDCAAFIFTAVGAQAVLLVESGRVAWKSIGSIAVAGKRNRRVALR